jgi:hypothetical protein
VTCRWCHSSLWKRDRENRPGGGRPKGSKTKTRACGGWAKVIRERWGQKPKVSGNRPTNMGSMDDGPVIDPDHEWGA